MSMEWKVVPVQSTNDIREAMRDKNTMQAKWAAGIAAAPTEGAPALVDAGELEALRQDAARLDWVIAHCEVPPWKMFWYANLEDYQAKARKAIDAALAANGEKAG